MSPFEALYIYKPPLLPATLESTTVVAVDSHLQQQEKILQVLHKELATAQNRMKQFAY